VFHAGQVGGGRRLDVSVVVPCFNGERYVRNCLAALSAQTYPKDSYEVILVNDGSSDRSAELARDYPVTVIDSKGRGSYAARNAGVLASSGPLLAFTDADCEVGPTWLEGIVAAMEEPRIALLLGPRRFAKETPILSSIAAFENEKTSFVLSQEDRRLYYGYTNNMAVRRTTFDRVGPFAEIERGADVVLVARTLEAHGCSAVRFSPGMQIRHLEIARWYDWHRKMFIYGQSYRKYHRLSGTRPLSYPDRFEVLRRTVDRNGYGPLRSALLFVSCVAASAAYGLGRILGGTPLEAPRGEGSPAVSRLARQDTT